MEYRPLPAGSAEARGLFAYAGAWVPPESPGELGCGAWVTGPGGATGSDGSATERMVGALLVERSGTSGLIHGPVVVATEEALEVAAQLMTSALSASAAAGVETLFARPQGLDRVWVRFGFIPVPEADLPAAFRGRPGTGLFAWRGGSALWSSRRTDTLERDDLR
ncbi:MAG: hypothetical protein HY726_02035 [Candidatus Rokubacteria bacterium]|nr:hypothetical protein [Candidatus Rokubacteria bacterium]